MTMVQIAAIVFAVVSAGVVVFQFALALGAPWGAYAMGGAIDGRFPPALRLAAVVQGLLIAGLALGVLSVAGIGFLGIAQTLSWIAWLAVVVSTVAVVLNAISRSAGERRLWVPVTLVMLASSLVVALTA